MARVPLALGLAFGLAAALSQTACTADITGSAATGGAAATGSIATAGTPGSPATAPSQPDATALTLTDWPKPSACVTGNPGPRTLRRLSEAEYQQSLRDIFGDDVPSTAIFSDKIERGFARDTALLTVQDLSAQQLMANAEAVAAWAVDNRLATLTTCTTNDVECRTAFVRSIGGRVARAPLSPTQQSAYLAIFAAESSFVDGAKAVVSALLQSPSFLYHRELGQKDASGSFQLTPFEVASSLSFLLIGGPPDGELRAAAEMDQLAQPEQRRQQALRLGQTPAGERAAYRIVTGWLGLDRFDTTVKDDAVFTMPQSLRLAMAEETRRFVVDQLTTHGTVASMLTAGYSFLNPELAAYYGVPAPSGADFAKVQYAGARASGILAHGSVLTGFARADLTSPVQRGRLVRTRLLCRALPPPPQNVDTTLHPPAAGLTTRQVYAEHSQNPACAGCHQQMDPIGFGFEHYDGFGRYRELEQGQPIDDTGTLSGVSQGDVAFTGIDGLSQYLASSESKALNECALRYFTYYAFGRASWPEDHCTYQAVGDHAAQSGFSLGAILEGIVMAPRFTTRTVDP